MTASAQHQAMPGIISRGGRHRARRHIADHVRAVVDWLPGSTRPLACWLHPSPRSRRARMADRGADRAEERITLLLEALGEPEGPEERLWPPEERLWPPEGGPSSCRHGMHEVPQRR